MVQSALDGSRRLDSKLMRGLKKQLIERQCQGLLEFVEPKWTLDTVVGHEPVKQRLREDAPAAQTRRVADPADGISGLRRGGHRQDISGAMHGRRDRHAVRDAQEFSLQVCRRDRRQPGARAQRAARDGTGGRGGRRSRRRAGRSRPGRRFRHVQPRVLDDRRADGRHALSRARFSGCCSPAGRICCRSI